ncbi:MAG: type II toxin-antitoxin system Phd/YefM family antitoxin [Clostridia bacterium]|nr:type II toxin-antitoxin system Phd/YefM family antitoxin [Clostridia bacterium]
MPQIIPIRDLRDTTKISKLCNNSHEPLFVTKNGYGDMVVMSMATYEQQLAKAQLYDKIMEGKLQADQGELIDGKTVMQQLKERYAGEIQL